LNCFDDPTKTHITDCIEKAMQPDGFMLLGEDENLVCVSDKFKSVPGERGIYVQADAPPASYAVVAASG
jgi:chemotaxis protein methyltransferase CheR